MMGILKAKVGGLWVPIGTGTPLASWSYGKNYAPGSNLSAGVGGGLADWFTIDAAVPVPAWATRFSYRISATYLQWVTAGGNVYNIRLVLGGALGNVFNFGDATKNNFDLHWTEQIPTVAPGSNQVLKVQSNRVAGTGTWSAGTFGTTVGVTIDWYA